ncbi:hypothetical protein MAR_025434, partial [Mya arenaria]
IHNALEFIKRDIVRGTETWLKGVQQERILRIMPYSLARSSRANSQFNGTTSQMEWEVAFSSEQVYIATWFLMLNPTLQQTANSHQVRVLYIEKKKIFILDARIVSPDFMNLSYTHITSLQKRETSATLNAHRLTRTPCKWKRELQTEFTVSTKISRTLYLQQTKAITCEVFRNCTWYQDHTMVVTDIDVIANILNSDLETYRGSKNYDMTQLTFEIISTKNRTSNQCGTSSKKYIIKSVEKKESSKMRKKMKSFSWLINDFNIMIKRKSRQYNDDAEKTENSLSVTSFQSSCFKQLRHCSENVGERSRSPRFNTLTPPYRKCEGQFNVNKLECVQRKPARFIMGDYKTSEEECFSRILDKLKLTSLQEHLTATRLIFLFQCPRVWCQHYPRQSVSNQHRKGGILRLKKILIVLHQISSKPSNKEL